MKAITTQSQSKRFYRFCYRMVRPIILFFRPIKVVGMENVPEEAALLCANHSALIDPFLIALALGIDTHLHILAKIELFKIPVITTVLRKLGMISVDRGTLDVSSIKNTLSYLKDGEKVLIFPEGTRVTERKMRHMKIIAKTGAVKLAERAGVPIVPVYIPRKKPIFRRSTIIFGKPYIIEKQSKKHNAHDYAALSDCLMHTIEALESFA